MSAALQILDDNGAVLVDLSAYLNVTPDDGMDTYDPQFTQRVISHSLLKPGGVLALEDLQAKEMTFPLQIGGANPSAAAAVVQDINRAIRAVGAVVSWQDDGLSQPTLFDIITGDLAISYNFRRGQQGWIAATLHLFLQPLGYTASEPTISFTVPWQTPLAIYAPEATTYGLAVPTSVVTTGALSGDAPALVSYGISYSGGGSENVVAIGVIPPPIGTFAYPAWQAPSVALMAIASAPAVIPGAPSTGVPVATSLLYFNVTGATINDTWAGDHRIFAYAYAPTTAPAVLRSSDPHANVLGVATVGAGVFQFYDLGVLTLETDLQYEHPWWIVVATQAAYVAGVALIPDAQLTVSGELLAPAGSFDGIHARVTAEGPLYPTADITGGVSGAIPTLDPSTQPRIVVMTGVCGATANMASADVTLRPRTRYVFP